MFDLLAILEQNKQVTRLEDLKDVPEPEDLQDLFNPLPRIDTPSCWQLYYLLLLYYGRSIPHLYKHLRHHDFIPLLIQQQPSDTSVYLLLQLIQVQELSILECSHFTRDYLLQLCIQMEEHRHDDDYSNALTHLLLLLDDQFESKALPSLSLEIIQILISRFNQSKSLTENLVFLLNRHQDSSLQILLLKFLSKIFHQPKLQGFFYTNDLYVMTDIVLRDIRNLSRDQEKIQQMYLALLPALAKATAFASPTHEPYKKAEIIKLLQDLESCDLSPTLIKRTVGRMLEDVENSPI